MKPDWPGIAYEIVRRASECEKEEQQAEDSGKYRSYINRHQRCLTIHDSNQMLISTYRINYASLWRETIALI